MDEPIQQKIERDDSLVEVNDMIMQQTFDVEYYHTLDSNSNTTFAVWAPCNVYNKKKLPIVLFQSGYGSDSVSHAPMLKSIASAGFIVVAPDHRYDKFGGCFSVFGFLTGMSCAAMSTDGSHLGKAIHYVKNTSNRWMDRADTNKIALMGFSMGGQEVIHANARFPDDIKAIIVLSGSIMLPLATAIGWNPCCYPFSGGSCTGLSDTPLGLCGMGKALRSWRVPSLFITSERDMAKCGMYRAVDIVGGQSTLITFKDEALDLEIPHTKKTTIWDCFTPLTCYGSPFYGLRQHFALASETKDISHLPINAFLRQHFYNDGNINTNRTFTEYLVNSSINSRSPTKLCAPFPLFRSCCEC